jgi:hypothetical protein
MCAYPFKLNRVFICGVNQDLVCFDVAVSRWLPRSYEWMLFIIRWKRDTLG